jgi:hypothetical protein
MSSFEALAAAGSADPRVAEDLTRARAVLVRATSPAK